MGNVFLILLAFGFLIALVVGVIHLSDWLTARQTNRAKDLKESQAKLAQADNLIRKLDQIAYDNRERDPAFELIVAEISGYRKEIEPQ